MSSKSSSETNLQGMSNAIRALSMDAVQRAKSGHPGLPMGMADVATVLFAEHIKFDPQAPDWPDRDRFILSAGHGSMLLYSLLHLSGYEDMTIDELKNFRQLGSKTAGHPEYGHAKGIEMTTGPLGQGIATAVGMALAEKMLKTRFGSNLVDHYTYVIAGDGCLMEGISHEAIDLAGHLKLSNLIVLFDDNEISIDGPTSLTTSMDQVKRFEAAGWDAIRINGHDFTQISDAIVTARQSDKPSLIACKTIIGYGSPNKQGSAATHGAPLGEEEIKLTRERLGWDSKAFEIPESILQSWRKSADRGRSTRTEWDNRFAQLEPDQKDTFLCMISGDLGDDFGPLIEQIKSKFFEDQTKLATRQSSQVVLNELMKSIPWMLSGSADLSGSNGTKTECSAPVTYDDFNGNYIHYGVREHGMAAAMNGIALHGGFIPFSGTFLAFADYCRPAIRLAAIMKQRVIHVMTHDSIGLGEDGPTHQPVEHLASLRAMPNVLVFRPADAIETAEAWACALNETNAPSIMCLTRQSLPTIRSTHSQENLTAKGAYVVRRAQGKRKATLIATGSEVFIAIEAAERLASFGTEVAVVSMPCWELFERQSPEYQKSVLGSGIRLVVEAASRMGWDRWIGKRGGFIGMSGFGASAPADDLYQYFDITTEKIVDEARRLLFG